MSTVERPNVLLITTDQQRWDSLGYNDPSTDLRTPICDQLAAGGTNFGRAYVTCPVCIPARRSLLSGLHPQTHGLRRYEDGLDWDAPCSLPELLAQAGWHTALIGKLHLHPQRKRYGYQYMLRTETPQDRWDSPLMPVNDWIDWLRERGIDHPYNLGLGSNTRLARPWDKEERFHHTSWLADRAVDFLVKYRDPSQPFFLHLSFWAPHPPMIPPQAYWDRYYRRHGRRPVMSEWTPKFDVVPRGIPESSAVGPFDENDMHETIAGYYGLINHIDDRIGYVLSRLFEYGSPRAQEPTLILFTSDHGEMLGDHHLWRKSLPYEGSSHVPFFIAGHKLPVARGVSNELVCLEDVVPTVLDMCGQPIPDALRGPLEGKSLAPILRGETTRVRERLFGECDNNHFVVEGDLKYCWFARTNEEQLFNLADDPKETRDLSANTSLLEPFRRQLAKYLAGRSDVKFDPAKAIPCANQPPQYFWKDRL
jgi:arylsulfatase A-like enzyme